MKAQIRPNRLDISDRFPLASFTIHTDGQPRQAEVVVATSPELFDKKEGRTRSTFYSSREHGVLSLPRAESVYTIPPEVLSRFTDADKLWFGMATAPAGSGSTGWEVDVEPTSSSPYISLVGLTDSAMRRVRMFPNRTPRSDFGNDRGGPLLTWTGDTAQPGMSEAGGEPSGVAGGNEGPASNGNGKGAATPPDANGDQAQAPYDDGFGPLAPSNDDRAPQDPGNGGDATAEGQSARSSTSDAERDRLDDQGIEGPVPNTQAGSQAWSLGDRPRALTEVEYGGARLMPSPAYSNGRRGQAIDRIAIHITDSPQSRYLGSWFTREEANSSSHYMVDQEGVIRQFVREQDTAWHAGNRAANRRSIGIEHVAVKQGGATYGNTTYPYTPPSEAEYRASARLVAHLCRKYGLAPNRTTIVGHNEINPRTGHGSCPTGAWDWDHYMAMVGEEFAVAGAVTGGVGAQALGNGMDPENKGMDCCGGHDHRATASALELTAAEYPDANARPSPNFTAGRGGNAINTIVIHITDTGNATSPTNTFLNAANEKSAHYLVDQAGAITQFVSEDDTAWHSRGANQRSIGIEHVAVKEGGATYPGVTFPHLMPTDAEYRASARLVAHLCNKYGLPANRTTIRGHNEVGAANHPSCPIGAWNWDTYMAMVEEELARAGGVAGGMGSQSLAVSQTINWDEVQVVPQPSNRSCWATAGAMLYGWMNHQSVTPATIAEFAGKTTDDYLNAGRMEEFAKQVGLKYDYGQSYTPQGFFDRLSQVGPLFVMKNPASSGRAARVLHCVIVTGMYKDGDQWLVRVADPWDRTVGSPGAPGSYASTPTTGSRYIMKYEDFVAEYESAAGVSDLQVLHAGGPSGHVPNTGSATPEGYAMSAYGLSDEIPLDPGEGGMSLHPGALVPGDLIVTTTAEPISGIIRVATGQPVSHVMLYVGQGGQVIEARGDGVKLKPLEQALSGATLAVVYRSPAMDEMKGLEIADKAARYLENGFDFVGIVQAGLFRVAVDACRRRGLSDDQCRRLVAWTMDGTAHPDRFFCSALVLRAYEDAARRLTVTAPNWASPGDIPEYTLRAGSLEYVGHLITPQTAAQTGAAQGYAGAMGAGNRRSINWDEVQLVPQPTALSCWATAAAMVIGWRDHMSVTPQLIADIAKRDIRNTIPADDFDDLAEAVGLSHIAGQSLPPEEWFALLESKGPLAVSEVTSNFGHVVVVTGMYNHGGNWFVRITDPLDRVVGSPGSPGGYANPPTHATGSRYIMTFEQFVQNYEALAPASSSQIIHTNGTHGHTPNRGTTTPPGYALSDADPQAVVPKLPANGAEPAPVPAAASSPSLNGAPVADHPFGPGVTVTRQEIEKGKRRYSLSQLRGFVNPQTGAMADSDALRAEPVLLDDWPYIDGPNGRTQAGVAIDWAHKGGAVGQIGITPLDGTSPNGWDVAVRTDLLQGAESPGKAQVKVRVTTTFSKQGEGDQVAVSEVTLDGDGRSNVQHGVGETGEVQSGPEASPTPAPAPQPVEA